jgi:hypothetical protein
MDITKLKRWNKLLSEIKIGTLFNRNVVSDHQKTYLAAPVCMANSIQRFCPDLLKKDNIHICVAGAEGVDLTNCGDAYRVLERIFGNGNQWRIDLVGPNAISDREAPFKINQTIGNNVDAHLHKMTLSDFLSKNDKPDLLVLNSPGFEEYSESWFEQEDGIKSCLVDGVIVIGCSYGDDEAQIDQGHAQAYGYKISGIYDNQYQLEAPKDIVGSEKGLNWAGQCWLMSPGTFCKDDALIDLLEEEQVFLHEISDSLGEAFVNRKNLIVKKDGKVFYKIGRGLAFNINDYTIVDGNDDVVIEDIELDATYLKNKDLTTPFNAMLVILIVRRDYLNEIEDIVEDSSGGVSIGDLFGGEEGLNSSVKGLVESFGGDLGGTDAETITQMLVGKGKREMSTRETEIDALIRKSDLTALSKLPKGELSSFQNEKHQSLMHISASINSIELYQLSVECGLQPGQRDQDHFTVIDVCAERDSLEVFKQIEGDFPDANFDELDPKGFNPMYRAYTYNSPRVYQALESMGYEPNKGHAARMMAGM